MGRRLGGRQGGKGKGEALTLVGVTYLRCALMAAPPLLLSPRPRRRLVKSCTYTTVADVVT